jgi:5,10-methylene-tetrahydrofolate dehydrogenase/methenyl tetrahydrofolate cyclohydrolase
VLVMRWETGMSRGEWIKPGAIVIDVGINRRRAS